MTNASNKKLSLHALAFQGIESGPRDRNLPLEDLANQAGNWAVTLLLGLFFQALEGFLLQLQRYLLVIVHHQSTFWDAKQSQLPRQPQIR